MDDFTRSVDCYTIQKMWSEVLFSLRGNLGVKFAISVSVYSDVFVMN